MTARPAAGEWARFRSRPEPAESLLQSTPRGMNRSRHSPQLAILLAVMLFASLTLAACGGGSDSAEAVPKSTPDIIPPTNTSAEKASAQTTSTSTTSKGATGTGSTGSTGEEGSGSESSGEPSSSEGSSESPSGGAAGGTSAGEKEKAASKEATKGESQASPSGGASAP